MFRQLAALLFSALALPAFAQSDGALLRNPKNGPLIVKVVQTANPPGKGQSGLLVIRSNAQHGFSQKIELGLIDRADVEIGDFNFDGIEDIRFRGVSVGLRNESSNFYVYNSRRNAFLSDHVLSRLSNPTFDLKLKQVTSINFGSGTSEYREIFKLRKHKWIRVSVKDQP